jgi:uncharacterized protein YutE (UPF0331/DUF86 family)
MSDLDPTLLAEKAAAVERHLRRVEDKLPADVAALSPASDASDAVILHLWQAVQIVIDLAVSACVQLHLGAPASYGDAFRRLASSNVIPSDLSERLVRAAGFRNVVAHAYEALDMARVHQAATKGPADLRAFLKAPARTAPRAPRA